ncbi:MAG TPA: hypothetical protein VJU81_25330 [Methylomirabilota bacterium]|nr:hypothetical protein [Methylomirabilota bacterium]
MTVREYHYKVDADGRVFHDGSEIVDAATLRFFLLGMRREADGRWLVPCQGEQNWFSVDDTPFVVQRLRLNVEGRRLRSVGLVLAGDLQEPLDPATLEAEGGRLYCRVRRGAFRARFGRIAMQQLAPYLEEPDGRLTLLLDGARHAIADARAAAGGVHGR